MIPLVSGPAPGPATAGGCTSSPDPRHTLNLRDRVDWARHLRVVDPCITQRSR